MKLVSKNLSLFTIAALALVDLLGAVPPASATPAPFVPIALETTQYNSQSDVDDMSYLATRSQRKLLTRAGTGPFTMTHTNANPQLSYQYQTDANYGETSGNNSHSGCDVTTDETEDRGCLAQLRESDIRPSVTSPPGNVVDRTSIITTTAATLEVDGWIEATPPGGSATNTKDGIVTFGAVFGPQVWSATFSAVAGSAISYYWEAAGTGDDYELYVFLVRVADSGSCTGNPGYGLGTQAQREASHSILTYSRGKDTGGLQAASAEIQNSGCYRLRFVNGSYDASGGRFLGSEMEISDPLLGSPQRITVDAMPDLLKDSSQRTVQISASSNAVNAVLTYTSLNAGRCTVNSSTGLVTVLAGAEGRCTFRLDSAAVDEFVAATSTFVSFEILADATAPVYSGGAQISGAATVCSTLAVVEGTWGTGGSAITSTTYQWFRDGTAISGATTDSLVVTAADVGSVVYFSVTKTNGVGATTAFSNQLVIVDARLTNLGTSGSTITFDPCTAAYAITSATNQFTITATANPTVTSLVIGGAGAISGQETAPITLNPGANTITVVATSGQVSRTTTLTVTWAAPPTVNILGVLFPTSTTATLQASINANGFDAETISFTVTPLSGQSAATQGALSQTSVTGTSGVTVTQGLTNLTPGNYRLVVSAENINGTATAEIVFRAGGAPEVITGVASNQTRTSASVSYTINTFNSPTDPVLLDYSTDPLFGSSSRQSFSLAAAGSATSGTNDLTGLLPGTRYYYRYSATNGVGSNIGAVRSFVTSGTPVVDVSPGIAGELSMTMKGVVNAAGLTTTGIRFYYGTDNTFQASTSVTAIPATLAGNADNTVSATVTGLAAGTYFYKVEATNAEGTTLSSTFATVIVTDNIPTAQLSAPATVTVGTAIALTVRFSEPVTGFAAADLVLSGISSPGYTALPVQEISPGVFAVTLTTTGTQTGTLTIALPAGVAVDSTNNPNTAATSITVLIAEAVVVNNPGSNNLNLPVISYPEPSVRLVIGSYTVLTPESTGGPVTSWAIDLTLPDGLAFDVGSGVISGTPTSPGGAINFTITGTNADGSATTQLQIEVLAYVRADGPLIEKINPRLIFSDETTQVTLTGKRLQLIDSVTIDGITITITLVSRTLATFEAPELEAGKKNLAFATDGHGMLMAFNGLEVIDRPVVVTESPVVPTPTDSPVVTPTDSPVVVPPVTESPGTGGGDSEPGQRVIKRTVSGFAPGSSELTDALKALIREKYEEVGSPLKVTCIGYTQGPTNLDSDRQLSLDRATVACDYLKTLNPEIEVLRMEGKQEVPVGSSVRRVEMYFVVPINS